MANAFFGRKLWRIPERGVIKGVCAGIAQYLDVPVKLVRLIVILSIFFGLFFFVAVAYIVLTFVLDPMPANGQQEQAEPSMREVLNSVDLQLSEGEKKLRAMERYITSDTFTLRSRFRKL